MWWLNTLGGSSRGSKGLPLAALPSPVRLPVEVAIRAVDRPIDLGLGRLRRGRRSNPILPPLAARPQPSLDGITPGDVTRELRDFARHLERRRRVVPRALLVGILAASTADSQSDAAGVTESLLH
jgi:hypothetical protein